VPDGKYEDRSYALLADNAVLLHEMVHQFLFERNEDPSHKGEPWCREIMRLTGEPVSTAADWSGYLMAVYALLLDLTGSTVPFAATKEEREARGDPRPSIAERYASRDVYLEQVHTFGKVDRHARQTTPSTKSKLPTVGAAG
jgi:hypothetical protein